MDASLAHDLRICRVCPQKPEPALRKGQEQDSQKEKHSGPQRKENRFKAFTHPTGGRTGDVQYDSLQNKHYILEKSKEFLIQKGLMN